MPAKKVFVLWSVFDCVDALEKFAFETRSQRKTRRQNADGIKAPSDPLTDGEPHPNEMLGLDLYEKQMEWEKNHPPPTIHVSISDEYLEQFRAGYQSDRVFREKWASKESDPKSWYAG